MIEIVKFIIINKKRIFPIFLFCRYFPNWKGLSPQSPIGEKNLLGSLQECA